MTAEQFAYWLQGYAELNPSPPTAEQWQVIRDHLALVFDKVTPDYPMSYPVKPLDIERQWPGGPYKVTCAALSGHTSARTVC